MPKVITDEEKIDEVLERGVADILPDKSDLKELLTSGKRIKLYQGFDPTGTELHIGHMVGLRKLRQFQDLGHHVIFLIGDGTGQAGDPSGKTRSREKYFNTEELRENAKDYVLKASKVVNFEGDNPAEILFNGDWLNDLNLPDILDIASNFSLQQLSERSVFQERIKKGEPVNLREFLYPLLQGYDSVAMEVDLEIGATDQTFNMLVGRTLVKRYLSKEKFVLTTPLLVDASGKKIGKTEGNAISISDKSSELFRKIMSLGDEIIVPALEYLTNITVSEIEDIKKKTDSGENPKKFKELLAFEVVKDLNSESEALEAKKNFQKTFSAGEMPSDAKEVEVKGGELLQDVLVREELVSSNSDFRRLVDEGAVKILNKDDEVVSDYKFSIEEDLDLRIGKKRFLKIRV